MKELQLLLIDRILFEPNVVNVGFEMGETIHLGIDYSTGSPREDKEEYYEEVVDEREFLKNRR